jgi:hypothetical protein
MSYENQISELYFLLHKNNINEIGSRLTLLLRSLKTGSRYTDNSYYLKTLYCLIGHVRDIYFGHGERDLAYMMIYVWYKFYPVLAIYAFHQFVVNSLPYGCWNDIKYFCKFISRISSNGICDPLIDIAVSCANRQLLLDLYSYNSNEGVSNLCKWIPRESKIEWLFEKLVIHWFYHIDLLHKDCSLSHQKKIYRQMIVSIGKRGGYDQLTIKNIFQCLNKGNSNSIINDTYEKSKSGCSYFHDNVFIGTYIKTAVSIIHKKNGCDVDSCREAIWLNHKWCQMVASFFDNKCSDGIPLIDISAAISDESLYHAIGFACLVAIKSGLFRILLVSNKPIWIEFTNTDSICTVVDKIWSFCGCRSGSQFSISFHLLMDALSKNKVHTSIKFFIFSQRFLFDWNTIIKSFASNCSFVFWNIGQDIPQSMNKDFYIDDHTNVLFVSGCNVPLFAKFCDDKNCINGSYEFLLTSLHSYRYKSLSDYFDSQTSSASPSIVSGISSVISSSN